MDVVWLDREETNRGHPHHTATALGVVDRILTGPQAAHPDRGETRVPRPTRIQSPGSSMSHPDSSGSESLTPATTPDLWVRNRRR